MPFTLTSLRLKKVVGGQEGDNAIAPSKSAIPRAKLVKNHLSRLRRKVAAKTFESTNEAKVPVVEPDIVKNVDVLEAFVAFVAPKVNFTSQTDQLILERATDGPLNLDNDQHCTDSIPDDPVRTSSAESPDFRLSCPDKSHIAENPNSDPESHDGSPLTEASVDRTEKPIVFPPFGDGDGNTPPNSHSHSRNSSDVSTLVPKSPLYGMKKQRREREASEAIVQWIPVGPFERLPDQEGGSSKGTALTAVLRIEAPAVTRYVIQQQIEQYEEELRDRNAELHCAQVELEQKDKIIAGYKEQMADSSANLQKRHDDTFEKLVKHARKNLETVQKEAKQAFDLTIAEWKGNCDELQQKKDGLDTDLNNERIKVINLEAKLAKIEREAKADKAKISSLAATIKKHDQSEWKGESKRSLRQKLKAAEDEAAMYRKENVAMQAEVNVQWQANMELKGALGITNPALCEFFDGTMRKKDDMIKTLQEEVSKLSGELTKEQTLRNDEKEASTAEIEGLKTDNQHLRHLCKEHEADADYAEEEYKKLVDKLHRKMRMSEAMQIVLAHREHLNKWNKRLVILASSLSKDVADARDVNKELQAYNNKTLTAAMSAENKFQLAEGERAKIEQDKEQLQWCFDSRKETFELQIKGLSARNAQLAYEVTDLNSTLRGAHQFCLELQHGIKANMRNTFVVATNNRNDFLEEQLQEYQKHQAELEDQLQICKNMGSGDVWEIFKEVKDRDRIYREHGGVAIDVSEKEREVVEKYKGKAEQRAMEFVMEERRRQATQDDDCVGDA